MSYKTHGYYKTPTYYSWISMRGRCDYPSSPNYHLYGGRGIKICDRWRKFEYFLMDMGPRPLGTTLGRIDNDGNYEPTNCRWETSQEQVSNKRNNHLITVKGKTKILAEWSRENNLPVTTIVSRYANGWSDEDAIKPGKHYAQRYLTANGVTKTIREWARDTGIPLRTINARRLTYKWSPERIVYTPVMDAKARCTLASKARRKQQ